jgi:Asp-tRNA(Asn)/Glu-tRNA(Gln) amidotransferase C subunit
VGHAVTIDYGTSASIRQRIAGGEAVDIAFVTTEVVADLAKGSYVEITKAQVEAMANQMGQMMQQMQQAMAQMPPEQRAVMEQMMKGRMGGASAPPQITVREKGSSDTVAQFSCERYEILSNGQVSSEVCAADPSQLKLDASAFETFRALADFYEPLRRMGPQNSGWSAPTAMDQIDGFPVQTIRYEGGRPVSEWVLQTVEERAIDAAQFTLPPNLKKTEMPQMPQGPPGRR